MVQTILITGGAGFIGRHTSAALRSEGFAVKALDLLNPQVHRDADASVRAFGGEVMQGDVRDASAVAAAMEGVSHVVHLAAETGVGQSMYEVDRYETVNVDGTRVVLDEAQKRDLPVVVASSRAVYGPGAYLLPDGTRSYDFPPAPGAVPTDSLESDPHRPVSVYGQTKSDAERIAVERASAGLPVISIRPQNVIGAGQALHNPYTGVLAAFAARLRQGQAPLVYGDGSATRDFIAVQDVAAMIRWLLGNVDAWSGVPAVNVGSGERTDLTLLATTARDAAGVTAPLEHVEITRPGDIDHACADLTVADAMGLPRAQVSLRQAVGEFIEFAESESPVDPAIWDVALKELETVEQHD